MAQAIRPGNLRTSAKAVNESFSTASTSSQDSSAILACKCSKHCCASCNDFPCKRLAIIEADEEGLGAALFGPGKRARAVMVDHKDAVIAILDRLRGQAPWNA